MLDHHTRGCWPRCPDRGDGGHDLIDGANILEADGHGYTSVGEQPPTGALVAKWPQVGRRAVDRRLQPQGHLDLTVGHVPRLNRLLAAHFPSVKVIVLTMSEDHLATVAAVRDGARGYVVKGADPNHVEHVINAVMAGDVVLDHGVAQAMAELAQVRMATSSSPFPQLSRREIDILELIAQGLDNPTIARELFLTPKTVRNHVSNVLAKLNAGDRSQAIVMARRSGLGKNDEVE